MKSQTAELTAHLLAMPDDDMGDLLGGYVAANPLAIHALKKMIERSNGSLGNQENVMSLAAWGAAFVDRIREAAELRDGERINAELDRRANVALEDQERRRNEAQAFSSPLRNPAAQVAP